MIGDSFADFYKRVCERYNPENDAETAARLESHCAPLFYAIKPSEDFVGDLVLVEKSIFYTDPRLLEYFDTESWLGVLAHPLIFSAKKRRAYLLFQGLKTENGVSSELQESTQFPNSFGHVHLSATYKDGDYAINKLALRNYNRDPPPIGNTSFISKGIRELIPSYLESPLRFYFGDEAFIHLFRGRMNSGTKLSLEALAHLGITAAHIPDISYTVLNNYGQERTINLRELYALLVPDTSAIVQTTSSRLIRPTQKTLF